MCKIVGALFLLGLGAVFGHPAKDELMYEMGGDTAVVESTVREARQVPAHIGELLKPDKNQDGEETRTLYRISDDSKDNTQAVDDFDFVYFGGDGDSSSHGGDKVASASGGGDGKNYEVNESYEKGGSTSYQGGHSSEGGDSKTYSTGDDKKQGYSGGGYGDEEESKGYHY